MAEFGILETGFKRKRYEDIIADIKSRARANFGESLVLDSNKPFGKYSDIQAWEIALVWEALEQLYNGFNVDTAEGIQLDVIVKWKGILRKQEIIASGQLRVYGTEGLVIPTNFIVAKSNGIQYRTTTQQTIGSIGYATLGIQCLQGGSRGNANIGEVNLIITPITGVTSVSNPFQIVNGQDYETDSELRLRYKSSVQGKATLEAIRNYVSQVQGVSTCRVVENYTEDEVNGIPPKSIQVYVYGGVDEEIAIAILDSKAAGIRPYGTSSVIVQDKNGYSHTIGFSRVEEIKIIVEITIQTNQYFSSGSIDIIKNRIVNYIGGEGTDGTIYSGLDINTNVIYSYLASLIWGENGITDIEVTIGTSTIPQGEENIEIGEFEKAICNAVDITIVEV